MQKQKGEIMGEIMGEKPEAVRDIFMAGLREELTDSLLLKRRRPMQEGTPYRPPNRTDDQDLVESPTKVVFGAGEHATEFLLWPKPHLAADEWRMATLNLLNSIRPALMQDLSAGSAEEIAGSADSIMKLANLFVAGAIPAMVEQVFNWETSLPRERILVQLGATDTQLATAFLACLQMAFPFYSTLKEVSRLIQGSQTPQAATSKAPEKAPET